ncbi:lipopolysaccharide biosynthesis protein [Shewanella goraebulensis]|uniref:lipopolysaccharide biosynthesis protein n=1 Tax=Shewanella goraebulensis TaxID=3050637 RepID=UPI00254E2A9B|nr:lipopolysaccharide biosynthesis protein [Shewanella goraebulensis]
MNNFSKNLNDRFIDLKNSISEEKWQSSTSQYALAQQLAESDKKLAQRVMQRVCNMNPKNEEYKQFYNLLTSEINSKNYNVSKIIKKIKVPTGKFDAKKVKVFIVKPFIMFVCIPFLIFAFYQIFIATERYESQSQLTVQQPDSAATMDATMALLSGFSIGGSSNVDTELVKAFIFSKDMLNYLDSKVNLKAHYESNNVDFFTRLNEDSSDEDFLEFYQKYTEVLIDEKSGVITLKTQAYTPEFSQRINQAIVVHAEWYINSISHQLAEAQVTFINDEHLKITSRLELAKKNLLTFQQRNNLLDPEAEGLAFQQITYGLESQIATTSAELKSLKAIMTDKAPQVMVLESTLSALYQQLEIERNRLSEQGDSSNNQSAVSEVLTQFSEFKIALEIALQSYTSSEISLQKAKVEAYRKLKFLVVVETSTLPQDGKYPKIFYNTSLFAVLLLMLFGVGRIVIATAKELG